MKIENVFLPGTNEPIKLPSATVRKMQDLEFLSTTSGGTILVLSNQMSAAGECALLTATKAKNTMLKCFRLRSVASRSLMEDLNRGMDLCLDFAQAVLKHQNEQIIELQDEIQELEDEDEAERKRCDRRYVASPNPRRHEDDIPF